MTNAENFVELVADLYSLKDPEIKKMQNSIPEIDAELKKFYWSDIKAKVQVYFARKNDKSRPRLSQILALLEADPNVQPVPEELKLDNVTGYVRPTTKIWSITHTFNKLVNVLTDAGVLVSEDGKYHNIRSLVNPQTDELVLNPRQWLGWQISDAIKARPDLFVKFPYATWIEQLAIAIENKLVSFKIRDWGKIVARQAMEAANV